MRRSDVDADEIDSYMYQTVGHDAVHAVAAAMGLPLYRAEITGEPLNQGAVYGARDPHATKESARDETEDLYRLLCTVKAHHPDVEGVSVGAILSNYQRVRVEHVYVSVLTQCVAPRAAHAAARLSLAAESVAPLARNEHVRPLCGDSQGRGHRPDGARPRQDAAAAAAQAREPGTLRVSCSTPCTAHTSAARAASTKPSRWMRRCL